MHATVFRDTELGEETATVTVPGYRELQQELGVCVRGKVARFEDDIIIIPNSFEDIWCDSKKSPLQVMGR